MATPETDWIGIVLAGVGGFIGALATVLKAAWGLSRQLAEFEQRLSNRLTVVEERLRALEREKGWRRPNGRREPYPPPVSDTSEGSDAFD